MESRGGLGIWKGHIWGPPLWVFTLKDKWSHWASARCEWAPSAHTAFLNAHQNNLSKPRDAFLRCLMWGQIGNHFNKIPLRLNCISQKAKPERGETPGTVTAEPLPAVFKACSKRGHLLCWQVYSGCTSSRNALVQNLDWSNAKAGSLLGAEMQSGVASSKKGSSLKTEHGEDAKPPPLAYFYMPSFWGWEDNNIPNPVEAILF